MITLIIIFTLSLLITRIASEILVHTGLSKDAAKFQARSAYTGVGYTTKEAEKIVNHPLRRKVIMTLMLIGNVGIISAIASPLLTFINTGGDIHSDVIRLLIPVISMGVLWAIPKSRWFERRLVRAINNALGKFTSLNVHDYVELLNLIREYEITVIKVTEGDWMEKRKVRSLNLHEEGIKLTGIRRNEGTYPGTPSDETRIMTYDQLILYGREKTLKNPGKRKQDIRGGKDHIDAVEKQKIEKGKQDRKDTRSKTE